MLIFIPIAVVAAAAKASPVIIFLFCCLAIIPLARYIGVATEELSIHAGTAVGGLLSAAFGNITELIIGLLALRAGLTDVVKASITGSILGNLLLVAGTAFLFGGWSRRRQLFNKTAALANASTLLMAIVALVMPAVFIATSPRAGSSSIEELSVFVAVFMLVVYVASLIFSLHTHKHLFLEDVGEMEKPRWTKTKSAWVLLASTAGVSIVSELLVNSITPLVLQFGWTQLFIGVIFVGMIGNAAEHTSAIMAAMRNRMDLSLQISIGSATQIAMFVAPVLVVASLLFAAPMNLIFQPFELVAVVLSVLMINMVVQDGESNWFEGVQLLMAYAVMAVVFFFHP